MTALMPTRVTRIPLSRPTSVPASNPSSAAGQMPSVLHGHGDHHARQRQRRADRKVQPAADHQHGREDGHDAQRRRRHEQVDQVLRRQEKGRHHRKEDEDQDIETSRPSTSRSPPRPARPGGFRSCGRRSHVFSALLMDTHSRSSTQQLFLGGFGLGELGRDLAMIDGEDAVAHGQHLLDIGRDEQNRQPFAAPAPPAIRRCRSVRPHRRPRLAR